MRNVIPTWGTTFAYKAGVEARDLGKDKTPPGGIGAQRRSWWLAGYNDRDIELQAEKRLETLHTQAAITHDEMRAKFSDEVAP